jgi:hypothetical protein
VIYCNQCGAHLVPGHKICYVCGAPVVLASDGEPGASTPMGSGTQPESTPLTSPHSETEARWTPTLRWPEEEPSRGPYADATSDGEMVPGDIQPVVMVAETMAEGREAISRAAERALQRLPPKGRQRVTEAAGCLCLLLQFLWALLKIVAGFFSGWGN